MAGTSPTRRSSRARTTQPQPQLSSAASSLSGRAERSSQALNKAGSPQKSTGSGSLSSEPPEDSTATTASSDDNLLLRRRSTRNRDDERDKETKFEVPEMAITSDDNEIQEDDEAVRCVCGYEDYPGLPLLDEDCKNHALKDAIDVEQIFSIELTDDLAGFFVQCDVCKVWEHGLCMGIVNEDLIPDDYYCELCRKDLHKIYAASNGYWNDRNANAMPPRRQKYSIYLPLHRPSRATSRATSATKEGARSPKSGDRKSSRTSAAAAAAAAAQSMAKRRSTMNSRDAAYDEEQLRRAIEISQKEVVPEGQLRRPKRSRDEDDEQPEIKRQRTNSKSPSPEEVPFASREESEDESATRNGIFKKSSRNTVRSQREKTEREERHSDPSEEVPPTARAAVTRTADVVHPPDPPVSSQPVPDTPPADQVPASSNKKRTGLHPKKKGRNQYTKDRDHHLHEDSPARSMSRDIARDKDDNHTKSNHEGGSKHSKSKGAMNSRITMTDLKRRANNLMEFITRTQVELANEPLSERNSPRQPASEDGSEVPVVRQNGSNAKMLVDHAAPTNGASMSRTQDFKEMSCVEMMDALTRDLVKWQQEFAA
ncbi:PHD-finger domain-containing protein [Seiridium cupressi]